MSFYYAEQYPWYYHVSSKLHVPPKYQKVSLRIHMHHRTSSLTHYLSLSSNRPLTPVYSAGMKNTVSYPAQLDAIPFSPRTPTITSALDKAPATPLNHGPSNKTSVFLSSIKSIKINKKSPLRNGTHARHGTHARAGSIALHIMEARARESNAACLLCIIYRNSQYGRAEGNRRKEEMTT